MEELYGTGGEIGHMRKRRNTYCKGEKVGPDMGLSVCLVGN